MEAIKKFILFSTQSSLKERSELFRDVFDVLRKIECQATTTPTPPTPTTTVVVVENGTTAAESADKSETGASEAESAKDEKISLPDPVYKTFGKLIGYLFPIYNDKRSLMNLVKFIDYLLNINCEQALRPVLMSLYNHSEVFVETQSNRNLAFKSANGIYILNAIISNKNVRKRTEEFEKDESDIPQLFVKAYANFSLASFYFFKQHKKLAGITYQKFNRILKKNPALVKYFDSIIVKLLGSEGEKKSHKSVFFQAALLMKYYNDENKSAELQTLKNVLVESYAKALVGIREQPSKIHIFGYNYQLKFISSDDFTGKVLPAIQKSMLRNPEIVFEMITDSIDSLAVNLSEHSADLFKLFSGHLLATNEVCQRQSKEALRSLMKQCTDFKTSESLLEKLFHFINGGEKLSSANQKLIILESIEKCSSTIIKNDGQILLHLLSRFGTFFATETHEPTLIVGYDKLTTLVRETKSLKSKAEEVEETMNGFFKKLLDNKSFSPLIRSNVYYLMFTVYEKSIARDFVKNFTAHFLSSIEKALTATGQNTPAIVEALNACLLLAGLSIENSQLLSDKKFAPFLGLVKENKKQLFTNDKFYTNLEPKDYNAYSKLFEKLVDLVTSLDGSDIDAYYPGYVYALLHENYQVRKAAQSVLPKITDSNMRVLVNLLAKINQSLEKSLLSASGAGAVAESKADGAKQWPSPKALIECSLIVSTSVSADDETVERALNGLLFMTNFSLAKSLDAFLFDKCLGKVIEKLPAFKKSDDKDKTGSVTRLIHAHLGSFVTSTTSGDSLKQNQLNAIQTLARLDGARYLKSVVDYSLGLLETHKSALLSVTKEECGIMRVPDGELYDKSLIESVIKQMEAQSNVSNVKRENKAYSYKDQLADMELRKEIEAKKGAQHIQPSLKNLDQIRAFCTKKQAEHIDQQIARENAVKKKMRELELVVAKATDVLVSVVEANPVQTKDSIVLIVDSLLGYIPSPLCAEFVYKVFTAVANHIYHNADWLSGDFERRFLHTRRSVIERNHFNMSVVNAVFRLSSSGSASFINKFWLDEPEEQLFRRVVGETYESIAENDLVASTRPADPADKVHFDLSRSVFVYPVLKFGLRKSETYRVDESLIDSYAEIALKLANYRINQLNNLTSVKSRAEKSTGIYELVSKFPASQYVEIMLELLSILVEQDLSVSNSCTAKLVRASERIIEFSTLALAFYLSGESAGEAKYASEFQATMRGFLAEAAVLFEFAKSSVGLARETCLKCLSIVFNEKLSFGKLLETDRKLAADDGFQDGLFYSVWLLKHDVDEGNRKLANEIFSKLVNEFNARVDVAFTTRLIGDVTHPNENVRISASEALASGLKKLFDEEQIRHRPKSKEQALKEALGRLIVDYDDLNVIIVEKVEIGQRVDPNKVPPDTRWPLRAGIGYALNDMAELFTISDPNKLVDGYNLVLELFNFFVNKGLNDRSEHVRQKMLEASVKSLNFLGKVNINLLLPLFEKYLAETPKIAEYDSARQNVVILMGTLAKHLDKDDPKVSPIIGKLVEALQTPSQQVQESVANCLSPLVPSIKNQVPDYVNMLLNLLFTSATYGERRGAAYGLAGMLKGVGMLSLRQLNVLQRLNDAIANKADARQREGALIAYEILIVIFNKVFEPYSVEILPNLLLCFGDPDEKVRQAADDCAKAMMANLTFTGVKMILPKLLERLGEEESWRTKCGSVELLGAMAHCAPKQLSTCLPNIVPKLIEILSDSHVKVQKAGTQALRQIGSVIKNPEILKITDILLEALQDPASKTQKALQTLLNTKFIHFIDAPSLALIMPVCQRAFSDRSTEVRKMAAQIMGNMYSLTDSKDLIPYLPSILPGIKLSLLDPVPDVRSVSSKALGAMIKALGENGLNEIISWLMEKLVSESSAVDRSGAAQGLSEVFGALGVAKLEKSMPEIIERAVQVDLSPFVRDGYIMMFIYLPLTFGDEFTPYVGYIIQPILKALADDCEFVRETAIKAGQRIVNTYAETAISLFLPELEKGLFDSNWRIRYSSVQLLGDLLYKISGVVGKMTTESAHDDDNFGTEKGSVAIIKALGEERRNRVYSGLYMGRSDVSLHVRQAALHVWKVIVSNTPKTLREILPTLFNLLLGCLASNNGDKRHIAAATLVDLVRKLGERILPDIIPILESGLHSDKSQQRQGVCIGLTEIMANTSRDNVLAFSDSLVPTVRLALMDQLPEVRITAAKTFDNLHNMIGLKALEEVCLPLLIDAKASEKNADAAERALDGIKQVMIVKSRSVLPFMIQYLTQPPVNINVLCKLCCCASTDVLSKHLSKILVTLVNSLALTNVSTLNANDEEAKKAYPWIAECETLLLSIGDNEGIKTIVNELIAYSQSNTAAATTPATEQQLKFRYAALDMLTWFCNKSSADYTQHVDDMIKHLLVLLNENNETILVKAWTCLNSIIDKLKGNVLVQRLPIIRQTLRTMSSQMEAQKAKQADVQVCLPGFCLTKKGINCLLPVFKEGLLNSTPELKELSAVTLTECIKLSNGESLKSSVMVITGPLIRVLGERYSWAVKSAVLDSIYHLLIKVDVALKPFLPQLQTTFLKCLNDQSRVVRLKSGYALSKLVFMNPKIDQMVLDVVNFIKASDENSDVSVKLTLINSLRLCLDNIGEKLTDETKQEVLRVLKRDNNLYNDDVYIRSVAAGSLGSLANHLSEPETGKLFKELTASSSARSWEHTHAHCMVIGIALKYNLLAKLRDAKYPSLKETEKEIMNYLFSNSTSDRSQVSVSVLRAVYYFIRYQLKNKLKVESEVAQVLSKAINSGSTETKELGIELVTLLVKYCHEEIAKDNGLIKIFLPMLVNGTRERDPTVRFKSEVAITNFLRLKKPDTILNKCLEIMENMKDSINDCVKNVSKECYTYQVQLEESDIDETILKNE